MAKSNNSNTARGKRATTAKMRTARTSTAKAKPAAKATTARRATTRTKRGTGTLPASRAEDATAKRTTQGARREKARPMEGPAGRRLESQAQGRSLLGAPRMHRNAPARLRPITQRQSRDEILATVATDAGVERPIVERVARSLSQTLTRHLMRNGSGRVDIPYLGAALWRGREGPRKARKMASPILAGRIVNIPAKRETAVARIRVHSALREIVARA